jgi:hypothetical protein
MIYIDFNKTETELIKYKFNLITIFTYTEGNDEIFDYGIENRYIKSINGILYENFSNILLKDIYEIQGNYEDLLIFKFNNGKLHNLEGFAYYNINTKYGKYYINDKQFCEENWLIHPDVVRYKRNKKLSLL